MRVFLLTHQQGADGHAVLVLDALAHGDMAPAKPVVHVRHVVDEPIGNERHLGHVDQMRPGVLLVPRGGGGSGQEARVPAHHDVDLDARQRRIVHAVGHVGQSHKSRRRRIPRRVVIAHEVVVHRLGHVDAAQVIVGSLGRLAHDAAGVAAVVAADVEEVPRVDLLAALEDALAIARVGLVARAAQGGTRRVRHPVEHLGRQVGHVAQAALGQPAHAIAHAEHLGDVPALVQATPQAQSNAHQRLVNNRRGAARLTNNRRSLG